MRNRQTNIASLFALMMPFSIGVCCSPCHGQLFTPQQQAKANRGLAPSGKDVKDAKNVILLRKPMELQDLPTFTGHSQFQRGRFRQTDAGQGCEMEFTVQEPHDKVFEWYRNVLQSYQWKITNNSPEIITATKNKNRCTIGVYASPERSYATTLTINYFLGNSNR